MNHYKLKFLLKTEPETFAVISVVAKDKLAAIVKGKNHFAQPEQWQCVLIQG